MSDNYAVIATGGKQEKVQVGQRLKVALLKGNEGDAIDFDKILMLKVGDNVTLDAASLKKAKVSAEILQHGKHDKIEVIKFKRRKKYRRTYGHRQGYTEIKITAVSAG